MDGGEVVVFYFAELEEARGVAVLGSGFSVISHRLEGRDETHFSQSLGAKSTRRSITMSPADVSRRTLIFAVDALVRCSRRVLT